MALVEREITSMLGAGWRRGGFSVSGMGPEQIADLQDLLGTYLDLAGEAFQRPSVQYRSIYNSVLNTLASLRSVAEEQVSDYEVQVRQLEAQIEQLENQSKQLENQAQQSAIQTQQLATQLTMVNLLENLINVSTESLEYIKTGLSTESLVSIPPLQTGKEYIPRTGPYWLHKGEEVRSAVSSRATSGEVQFSVNIAINESKNPRQTAIEIRKELEHLLRSGVGRAIIQSTSKGR